MPEKIIYTCSDDARHVESLATGYAPQGFESHITWDDVVGQYQIKLTPMKQQELPKATRSPNMLEHNGQEAIYVQDLAKYLQLSESALYNWRADAYGPISHKYDDRVFYYWSDVAQYLAEQYIRLHTPESGQPIPETKPLVKDSAAAKFLGVTVNILYRWRIQGVGPNYLRLGTTKVRYRQEDLDYYKTVMEAGDGPKVRPASRGPRQVNIAVVPASVPPAPTPMPLWKRVLNYKLW
jgi:predicted DNA-binding transcriptional regulator AlpA